jgi:YVTN family beta-propeller protein
VGFTLVPSTYPLGVAVSPDGSKVYVANQGSSAEPGNTVSVIATATNTVTATIAVGSFPEAFGVFIQPGPRFAGTPGYRNCHGQSVSALARQYRYGSAEQCASRRMRAGLERARSPNP